MIVFERVLGAISSDVIEAAAAVMSSYAARVATVSDPAKADAKITEKGKQVADLTENILKTSVVGEVAYEVLAAVCNRIGTSGRGSGFDARLARKIKKKLG
jgi:hypothetical protein